MKILRITLNNIASLSGTHTVDFTREPLRSAGLFSISGPTGSGKSTLLDALCLSLYDATPRLEPFRRSTTLVDLAAKESQADPRSLLRRGAGEGYTEVAFVGVDGLSWTARWTVRRGHKKSDGALQNVDMALYRGHIAPGSSGTMETSGTKTDVLSAIRDKIGLTFQQFTRAVLLAQNDFATFLKAKDSDRAEILQALTGTERFETISKATYQRAVSERQAVEHLQSRLQGNAPLSTDLRTEAEAAASEAGESVRLIEQSVRVLESQTAWFKDHAKIKDGLTKAQEAQALAVEKSAAASSRRQELDLTETVSRDARPLRNAELQAAADIATAATARELAVAKRESCAGLLADSDAKQKQAEAAQAAIVAEQSESRTLLNQARALDATLAPLQLRFVAATAAVDEAKTNLQTASVKLQTTNLQRVAFLTEQSSLESDRERLACYLPFVGEAAMWLDRLDAAAAAQTQVSEELAKLKQATEQLSEMETRIRLQKETEPALQAAFDSAERALHDAMEAASRFDTEHLAADRSRLDTSLQVVTRLGVQLRELQTQQSRATEIQDELEKLTADQATDIVALRQKQDVDLPAAAHTHDAAKTQLELIKAAIDDHAKRLRATLQTGENCPVCGSVDHPYSQHAPDLVATAVKAAEASVRNYEKRRDEIKDQIARLDAAVNARTESLARRQTDSRALTESIAQWTNDSKDHSEVAAVLYLAADSRLLAAEQRVRDINSELQKIAESEKEQRAAAKQTDGCRKKMEQSRDQLQSHHLQLGKLETQQGIAAEKLSNAKRLSDTAEQRRAETHDQLRVLWAGLPDSRVAFERDSGEFRTSFQTGTTDCGRIERRLAELVGEIQKADAAMEPLQDSQKQAQQTQDRCASELKTVASEREQQLSQRKLLYEGRAADAVEAEIHDRLQFAAKSLENAASQRSEADKNLTAALSELDSSQHRFSQAETKLVEARDALARWLADFASQTSRLLTTPELDEMLTRNDEWFKSERMALAQLDAAVTSADGAVRVHATQLQDHVALRPTEDPEATVLERLESQQAVFAAAKEKANAARAVILSDDDRRRDNSILSEQIQRQQEIADPWLKLNELIGSSDGAKFKMIAQRRTLDILLQYSNLQLNQLAMRYRLERLPESLNLVVIDRDMGDEKRSILSLSGGESFLVSLALALGLASLTSNRLQIESLFIDEGFGSLDSETLNIAMSALMTLENQGRKVGVISHVTEMTDAIQVQIKVVKGGGGASRIVVPGADPNQVNPQSDLELSANTLGVKPSAANPNNSDEVQAVATAIVAILQREAQQGKSKVSTTALRKEIGCYVKDFSAAQVLLGKKIVIDGRSLRLAEV